VCGVAKTEKAGDLNKIGKFGIGFKSVYAYTTSPRIYSGDESFRIENYVRPYPIEPRDEPGTLFVFPFDDPDAQPEIAAALAAIEPSTLLFLSNIKRLRTGPGMFIERRTEPGPGTSRQVTIQKGRRTERWLVWSRDRVEIAFAVNGDDQIVPCASSPLVVFLPTQKETFLGFLVQGPYRTTPARDNIGEHDPDNQALARQTAALLTDVLRELRDDGLLTADVLATLPLEPTRFEPGTIFRPLFDAVREALSREELIPVAGGGYRAAAETKLTGDPEVRELFGAGHPYVFTDDVRDPRLYEYLNTELGIAEVTPDDGVAAATEDFLVQQSDGWIARFYGFLLGHPSLWRDRDGIARDKPIIRLEDGTHTAPFDAHDRPAAFLPATGSGLPSVRRAVAEYPAASRFLAALGFATADVVDEVLQAVLPEYEKFTVASLDAARHDADLDLVFRALDEAPAGRRAELAERLRTTAFLVGENAATGEQRLMPPGQLYQRSKELEVYFDGNPDAWFAADTYGPWLVQLRGTGVRDAGAYRDRPPGLDGHVLLADGFARHERGVDGFDPDAEIDGLEFALRHPGQARSEYVWNRLLAPNRRLLAGVVEKSVRDGFVDSSREDVRSAIAEAASAQAWLPAPDGTFRRPPELSLDDLPAGYAREDALAAALGMGRPVVAEAARQLGLPPDVLWGLSAHPDVVAVVQRELEARKNPHP
jgi:hypothetical protein